MPRCHDSTGPAGPAVRRAAVLTAMLAAVGGCASSGQPVQQTLRVDTPGCPPAQCTLSNDRGRWTLARTPGTVTVTTSQQPLQVACRAEAGPQGSAGLPSAMAPVSGAGAVAGGVVGGGAMAAAGGAALSFIPALGLLAVMGAVAVGAVGGQTLEAQQRAMRYPEVISVFMNCAPPALPGVTTPGPRLGLAVRGLTAEQVRALVGAAPGPRGAALVTDVAAGSAAAGAGLRAGDLVLSADGQPVRDAADLAERVQAWAPGAPLRLGVWRAGAVLDLALVRPAAP